MIHARLRRKDIPSWIPGVVGIGMALGILALLLPALWRGSGSFTSSYDQLATITANSFSVHIDRFRFRPHSFSFAVLPTSGQSNEVTQSVTGRVRVFSKNTFVGEYSFSTTCCEYTRPNSRPNDTQELWKLLMVYFGEERIPKALQARKSYDFEFHLSSPLPTNSIFVLKYWHTRKPDDAPTEGEPR